MGVSLPYPRRVKAGRLGRRGVERAHPKRRTRPLRANPPRGRHRRIVPPKARISRSSPYTLGRRIKDRNTITPCRSPFKPEVLARKRDVLHRSGERISPGVRLWGISVAPWPAPPAVKGDGEALPQAGQPGHGRKGGRYRRKKEMSFTARGNPHSHGAPEARGSVDEAVIFFQARSGSKGILGFLLLTVETDFCHGRKKPAAVRAGSSRRVNLRSTRCKMYLKAQLEKRGRNGFDRDRRPQWERAGGPRPVSKRENK